MPNVLSGARVLILTFDLRNNSTGRTFVIWDLVRRAGGIPEVVAPKGEEIWRPLRDHEEFRAATRVIADDGEVIERARGAALLIAVKPHPGSLGRALTASKWTSVPILADVDDPDLEVVLRRGQPLVRLAKFALRPRVMAEYSALDRALRGLATIVSNPTLRKYHGGTIIPHARQDRGDGVPHIREAPRIAFVGSNRPHKGVDVLREAVAKTQDIGASLVVTASAPADAMPWEEWVGQTSFDAGIELVKNSDIVVIPSSAEHTYSRAQLPAKLMDAMLAGRAVIVSDLPPLRWAIGDAGTVVEPDNADALAAALRFYADPGTRAAAGSRARARGLEMFTPEASLGAFLDACERAAEARPAARASAKAARRSGAHCSGART